jgi:SAM-dependent methyltransferase
MAQQLVTGAEYVAHMSGNDADRRARAAFQALALRTAPVGGRLFDFGAGPGIDAQMYAEHGLSVATYDVDARMREYLRDHCRNFIAAGKITATGGTYEEFLARDAAGEAGSFDLITSNFAPLNLIEDLPQLFAKFHALTRPSGQVLVSVLNPYYFGDLKYGWWWRNAGTLWRAGHYAVPGSQAPIVRRRLHVYAVQSERYFVLRRAYSAAAVRAEPANGGIDLSRGVLAGLRLGTERFMFLQFDRRP